MDCRNFEQLIVEYIDGDLDAEMMQICTHHLSQCEKCSELNENYKSIRSEIKKWEQEAPSAQVLESIRQHAREEGVIKETPFYKKLFYTPILVPAFAAVVILVIVMNYGTRHVDISGLSDGGTNTLEQYSADDHSEALRQKKPGASLEDTKNNGNDLSEPRDVNSYMAKDEGVPGQADMIKADSKETATNTQVTENEQLAARSESSTVSGKSGINPQSPGKKISESKDTEQLEMAAPAAVSEMHTVNSVYSRKLNLVTSLQYQGKCSESIKEAEKLINSDPEPPLSIIKNAYVSQAECYEETGKYNKAIEIYKKLQKLEPSKAAQFSIKIEDLANKAGN